MSNNIPAFIPAALLVPGDQVRWSGESWEVLGVEVAGDNWSVELVSLATNADGTPVDMATVELASADEYYGPMGRFYLLRVARF